MGQGAKEALRDVVSLRITETFKAALSRCEDIFNTGRGDIDYDRFRQRVLRDGNDQIRRFEEDLDKFDIEWGRVHIVLRNNPNTNVSKLKEEGE